MAHTRAIRLRTPNKKLSSLRKLAGVLSLALALSSTAGCMVMDELDTAAAKMPTKAGDKKKAATKANPGSAAERLAATKSTLAERSQKWWREAKTMTPGESVAGIVSCRLPEGTQFMTQDDCLAQGGRAAEGGS